jgi:hypothetical protein
MRASFNNNMINETATLAPPNVLARARNIKLFLMDVDGTSQTAVFA